MSPEEYISKSTEELMDVAEPIYYLAHFYCTLYGITTFKEIHPAIGKLIKQQGLGTVFNAIIRNYRKGIQFSKETFYKDILFTTIGMKKARAQVELEPTSMLYSDYIKLRESANVR